MSGSPLSQYLAFANYASKHFGPELYIFLIIENDFDESFESVKKAEGFFYFDYEKGLRLLEYNTNPIKLFILESALKSAFFRYFYLDLGLTTQLRRIFNPDLANEDINRRHGNYFLDLGRRANERFLHGIEELSAKANVIILLDGDRQAIYSGLDERDSNKDVNILYKELAEDAKKIANVDVIDLHENFKNDYEINRKKFEYEYDYHWNEHGHSIAAQALSNWLLK